VIIDKLHLAGVAAVVLVAAIGLHEHDAKVREQAVAAATEAAQATYQKQVAAEIAALERKMSDRDAAYQKEVSTLNARIQTAASPQQIAQLVSQLMGLKTPVQIVTPPATSGNPNPQPIAQVSLSEAPQVKAYVLECETCKTQLPKIQSDLADREKQIQLAKQQIESITKQRDGYRTAAKGGTLWQRTVRALEYLGIGAGVGAGLVCGSGHCR